MLIGAIAGAIFALVGAGVGWLLTKLSTADEPPKWPIAVCAALAVALGQPLAREWKKPTADTVLAEMEAKEPFYVAIQETQPETYEKIRSIIARNIASGTPQAARAEIRQVVFPAILNRVPATSPETLTKFVQLAIDQGMFLAQNRPDLCTEWLTGQDAKLDQVIPPILKKREMAIYEELLRGSKVQLQKPMSEAEITDAMLPALSRIAAEKGVTLQQVGEALQQRGPEKLQCEVGTALYQKILAMPPARGEAILRSMLASASL